MTSGEIIFAICVCVLILIAFFGNVVLLYIITVTRSLHTLTNVFIVSLALNDLVLTVSVLPVVVVNVVQRATSAPVAWCPFQVFIVTVCHCATILNLAMVTLDRCVAVSKPLHYATIIGKTSASVMLATVWVVSLTFGSVSIALWKHDDGAGGVGSNQTEYFCDLDWRRNTAYMITYYITIYLIPTCLILTWLCMITKSSATEGRRIFAAMALPETAAVAAVAVRRGCDEQQSQTGFIRKTRLRTARTLGIILGMLALLWLPAHVFRIIKYASPGLDDYHTTEAWIMALTFCSTAINPITITIMNSQFFKQFQKLCYRLRCGCCSKTAVSEFGSNDEQVRPSHLRQEVWKETPNVNASKRTLFTSGSWPLAVIITPGVGLHDSIAFATTSSSNQTATNIAGSTSCCPRSDTATEGHSHDISSGAGRPVNSYSLLPHQSTDDTINTLATCGSASIRDDRPPTPNRQYATIPDTAGEGPVEEMCGDDLAEDQGCPTGPGVDLTGPGEDPTGPGEDPTELPTEIREY